MHWYIDLEAASLVAQMVKNLPAMQENCSQSSILVWRMPWTEEPGRPQSRGSQRVRHDWVTSIYRFGGEVSLHSSTFISPVLSLVALSCCLLDPSVSAWSPHSQLLALARIRKCSLGKLRILNLSLKFYSLQSFFPQPLMPFVSIFIKLFYLFSVRAFVYYDLL